MAAKKPRPPLGQAIADARNRAEMTQQDLAKLLGVSRETIGNWERGRASPDGKTPLLEDALNITLRERVDATHPEAFTIEEALNRLRAAEEEIDRARVILRVVSDQIA